MVDLTKVWYVYPHPFMSAGNVARNELPWYTWYSIQTTIGVDHYKKTKC